MPAPTPWTQLNDLPIKRVDGTVVYLRDVAHVRDGYSPQQNMVRVNGLHSVLTTIQKNGSVSTLSIISQVKELLPLIKAGAPAGLHIGLVGDQSIFVKAAVTGVAREGIIAAVLTALMILLFLGSLRSTLIITLSIPLAVLTSILCLSMLGQTINVMTLGGLALAVGILVDDATVTIENINWHLEQGKPVEQAVLDGGQQIIIPALFSFLSISIVFVPMFYLSGVARYLFVPMAEAVVFALHGLVRPVAHAGAGAGQLSAAGPRRRTVPTPCTVASPTVAASAMSRCDFNAASSAVSPTRASFIRRCCGSRWAGGHCSWSASWLSSSPRWPC